MIECFQSRNSERNGQTGFKKKTETKRDDEIQISSLGDFKYLETSRLVAIVISRLGGNY